MSSIFARLGYDFDTDKFGDSQYLTPAALKTLNASPATLKQWQIDDIANSVVSKDRYVQNPMDDICTTMISNLNDIKTFADMTTGVPESPSSIFVPATTEAGELSTACSDLIIEIGKFKSHTDNISGLTFVSSNAVAIPTYDSATALGQQLLRILNVSDNVANSTPMLGSFTSLFVLDDVTANNDQILADKTLINDNYTLNGGTVIDLSIPVVNGIITDITNTKDFLEARRTHDWNFYQKSYAIVQDYSTTSRYTNMGNTQTYLVNNLIGTETLKNNLANT